MILLIVLLLVNAFRPEWLDSVLSIFYLHPRALSDIPPPLSYKFDKKQLFFPGEHYSAFVRRRRTYVFLKVKPKKFLNWIDYMYIICLRDMHKLHYKPIVLVHDFAYDPDRYKIIFRQANDEAFINSRTFVRKIVGRRCRILTVSESLKEHEVSFADLYTSVFSPFSHEVDTKTQDDLTISYPLLMDLLYGYYVKAAIESFLSWNKSRSAIIIQFEARQKKWKTTRDPKVGILLCREVKWRNQPLATKNYTDSINITDPERVLQEKVNRTGLHTSDASFITALTGVLLSTLSRKKRRQLERKIAVQGAQEALVSTIAHIRACYDIPQVER